MKTVINTNPTAGLKPWGVHKATESNNWMGDHYKGYPLGPDGRIFFSRIVKVHEIGDFIIIEHLRGPSSNRPGSGGETMYAVYVNDMRMELLNGDEIKSECHRSTSVFNSLDHALLHAIQFKHEAANINLNAAMNSQVCTHFWRMVKEESDW